MPTFSEEILVLLLEDERGTLIPIPRTSVLIPKFVPL